MLEMVYDPTSPAELKFIDLLHNLVIPHVKLVIEFVGVNGIEYLRAERNSRIRLDARLVDLQKFIFSDRCHLAASTLARVCPSMTGLKDNVFQSLQDVSFVVAVEFLPEGDSRVL